jgi:NADH-quinone oxidoreductase subunit J
VTLYSVIFYVVAAVIVVATALAVTRRNPIHAVVYLVVSFLGSGVLFFLLGAPFIAAVQVIIYAGAIMVLFLFVVMMFRVEKIEGRGYPFRQWGPALLCGVLFFALLALVAFQDPGAAATLKRAAVSPGEFGRFVFERYWLSIEMISLLLFLGLLAAIHLGRVEPHGQEPVAPAVRRNPPKLQSSFAKASEDTRTSPQTGDRGFLRRRAKQEGKSAEEER